MMEENKNDRKNEYVIEGEKFNRIWGENSRKKERILKEVESREKVSNKGREDKNRREGHIRKGRKSNER